MWASACSTDHGLHQASRQHTIVLAIVRNVQSATHLTTAVAGLKNVHVLEGDVTDYRSLEVCLLLDPSS